MSLDKKSTDGNVGQGNEEKYVYYFGRSGAEGSVSLKHQLGGKGANLAEMANLGLPVPPGFTISAELCDIFYRLGGKYPASVQRQVADSLAKLEVCLPANRRPRGSVRSRMASSKYLVRERDLPPSANSLVSSSARCLDIWGHSSAVCRSSG